MEFVKTENRYIIRLKKGEKIIESLTKFSEEENIKTAFFYAIGAVLSAELAYYNLEGKKYQTKSFTTIHEISSLSGNIALVDKKPFIHAHCVLSNNKFECVGGHLKEGVVGGTCEICLTKEDLGLERIYDKETGLKLINCNLQ